MFTLFVDGGGTATSPTYFSYRCIETQQGEFNPIRMDRFYLTNLSKELLPPNCSIVDTNGKQSNNIAEYCALVMGLERFKRFYDGKAVKIFHDSEIVHHSVLGLYQCKAVHLIPWYNAARRLWWNKIDYQWINREEIVKVLGH
jgi:ribonuclease HI